MRFGRKLAFLSILLVGLVATMIVMKYIIEGFDTCSIGPTSVSASISVNGNEYCVSPGSSLENPSSPFANAGDTISIQYGGAFNAPIMIQYDNSQYTITPKPDGSWPRADNVQFVVPSGRSIQTITVGNNAAISAGILTWLTGIVAGSGFGSGSGYSSGTVPDTSIQATPISSNVRQPQAPVSGWQPQALANGWQPPTYNQTIAPNQDCSTFNDCSC